MQSMYFSKCFELDDKIKISLQLMPFDNLFSDWFQQASLLLSQRPLKKYRQIIDFFTMVIFKPRFE